MSKPVRSVMTENLVVLPAETTIQEAARAMRDQDVGDVLVQRDGQLSGLVTDRDIVVRAVAEGLSDASLADVCTRELIGVDPDADVKDAARIMTDHAIRRLPVLENGEPIGMVSLGDLAQFADPKSALAEISSAPPNN